ncbi:MAG: hypothetical protein FWD90_12290 [Defluviitaleaceae bacterium]|nr:hypothetical protein [Defluviitaleaceae bacterium]
MVRDFFGWIWSGIRRPIDWVVENVLENILEFIAGIIGTILEVITGALSAILRIVGRIIESVAEFVRDIALEIADALVNALDTSVGFFKTVVDGIPDLFENFEAFVSDIFPFMPTEFVMLLTFGIVLLAAVALIKLIVGIFT